MTPVRNYDGRGVTLVRKIQNIELCTPYQYSYQVATKKSSLLNQLKLEGYSERAMNFFFINSSLGRSQGGHTMLSPFFQCLYCTVLFEKKKKLLPTFSRCAVVNYYTLYPVREMGITRLLCYSTVSQKREFAIFFCAQLHCIEFNVPRTNFSTKQLREKNAMLQNRTRSTLS